MTITDKEKLEWIGRIVNDIKLKLPKSVDYHVKQQLDQIKDVLKKRSLTDEQGYQEALELDEEDNKFFDSLNLITFKPLLYICNVDERSVQDGNILSDDVEKKAKDELNGTIIISAAIESQIAEFENQNDKIEMLRDLGLKETTLNKKQGM